MIPVSASLSVTPVQPLEVSRPGSSAPGDFGSALQTAIANVESANSTARTAMEQFVSGDSTDLHNVALAAQKAGLGFEMFLQVRNKVVQAYQEVMRMQF